VDDPLLVCCFERLGDLLRDGQRLVKRDRAFSDALRESRPFNQLHDQRRQSVGSLQPVNRRDIGMVQRGQRLRFTVEARESVRVRRHRRGQHLDRHVPGKIGIGGSVDFTHATHTDLGTDLVRADATAWGERHAGTA